MRRRAVRPCCPRARRARQHWELPRAGRGRQRVTDPGTQPRGAGQHRRVDVGRQRAPRGAEDARQPHRPGDERAALLAILRARCGPRSREGVRPRVSPAVQRDARLPPGAANPTRGVPRVATDRHVGRHEGGGPPPQSDACEPCVVSSGPAGITGPSSPVIPGVGCGHAAEAPAGLRGSGGRRAAPVPWGLWGGIWTRRWPRHGEPGETPPPKSVKDGGGRACPGPVGVDNATAPGRGRRGPASGKRKALPATRKRLPQRSGSARYVAQKRHARVTGT